MRVPNEFAKAADAIVIVRIETKATGKLEATRKLADIPAQKAPEARAGW
ncbi:MAG: hypothetical protein ACM359_14510 [Bacillota bacterium]